MIPVAGKFYRVRIASSMRKERDEEVVLQCLGEGLSRGQHTFDIPLSHEGDEGRGVTIQVAESDILAEVE